MLDKLTPIPILGGLALQLEPAFSDNWAAMVGVGAVALVAVVVTLDKLGFLKKFGSHDEASAAAQKDLKDSLDNLGGKVDQLTATMNSQVQILGGLSEDLKESNKTVANVYQWIQVQEEVRKALGGAGG